MNRHSFRYIWLMVFILFVSIRVHSAPSVCFGNTANGHLKGGVKLPLQGENFVSYSVLASTLGRTYVHSSVHKIILSAYEELEKSKPEKVYKYAETGFKSGGKFKPHKTHQNGLSVDFMTPVTNGERKSVHLPTHSFNRFGYDIEFDDTGRYKDLTIDYEAMAAHIVALHKEAKKLNYDIWRVIFDPKLQKHLFTTSYGTYLSNNIQFSKKPSWVRHDEHYHIDFVVPCDG